MITGIGVDAVKISRMEKWANNENLIRRYFDLREIKEIKNKGKNMIRSLAVRFAAKEAFGKALGTGFAGIMLKDIMILNNNDQKPVLYVEGSALNAMKNTGADKIHVSLTHDGDIALAFVVLEDQK
ncbi:MAG: holo-ACP synthase [Treponema sp.]|jgi:holo-[acyl-carrier protein] synthase|nr:holo-ACP synthase [Treponema sp.]